MSKKQTIRTLGSIERIQPTQRTPKKQTNEPKQDKPKKLTKELDLELDQESDFDIENFSDGNDDVILEKVNLKAKKPDVKKKRVISDDQKKILVDRLAYARSLRKKESENKKALEEDYLKQKEEEINERLMKKFTSLQRKKENEMMKKYMTKPMVESES